MWLCASARFRTPARRPAHRRGRTHAGRVTRLYRKSRRAGTPDDLTDHAIILGPSGLDASAWTFRRDNLAVTPRVEGKLTISANEGAIAAAVAGLGIVSTGRWGCLAEIKSGALIQVLPDWQMETAEVHALFPAGRAAKPAARAFVDYLLRDLGKCTLGQEVCM